MLTTWQRKKEGFDPDVDPRRYETHFKRFLINLSRLWRNRRTRKKHLEIRSLLLISERKIKSRKCLFRVGRVGEKLMHSRAVQSEFSEFSNFSRSWKLFSPLNSFNVRRGGFRVKFIGDARHISMTPSVNWYKSESRHSKWEDFGTHTREAFLLGRKALKNAHKSHNVIILKSVRQSFFLHTAQNILEPEDLLNGCLRISRTAVWLSHKVKMGIKIMKQGR